MADDVEVAFGESLRQLFAAAGDPTLESCVRFMTRRRSPVSAQRISDWRSGRHRPKDFQTVVPLLDWLTQRARNRGETGLLTSDEWKTLWCAVNPSAEPKQRWDDDGSAESLPRPFAGLRALTADDSAIFFGRTSTVEQLELAVTKARSDGSPIVVITGSSGAGKSSVLGAGLSTSTTVSVVGRVRPSSTAVAGYFEEDALTALDPSVIPVFVVDQFEQTFTDGTGNPAGYIDDLVELAVARSVVVIVGVRSDFFEPCVALPPLARAWQHNCVIVQAMTDRQLREAITGPARLARCRVDTGLADLMIADVHRSSGTRDTAGQLPLLAHVLQVTWARRSNGRMTVSGYRASGGVTAAVAETAERAWAAVPAADRQLARDLLIALTHLSPDGRRVRLSLSPTEVAARFGPTTVSTVETFVAARLLVVGDDGIELVHDVVLDAWPRLKRWIDEDREAAVARQEIATAAQSWIDADRHHGFLYGNSKLATATSVIAPRGEDTKLLSNSAKQFLSASQRHINVRQRARRTAIAAVILLAVVSLVAASVALLQTRNLTAERNDANFRSIMAQLSALRPMNPSLAAELTLVAYRQRPKDRIVIGDLIDAAGEPLQSTLPGHIGAVYGVAYNHDGSLLASAGEDRTVQLWQVGTETPKRAGTLRGYGGYVTSVSFNPKTSVLATGSGDGTVRFFDVNDAQRPREIGSAVRPGHGTVYNVAFSPDGRTLAAPSDDGSVTLLDVSDPARPIPRGAPLLGHVGAVRTVAFSPDGHLLATGGDDATTRLWDVTNPARASALPTPIRGLGSINHSVSFDRTGTRLAITGDAINAQVWDVMDPAKPRQLVSALPSVTAKSWSITYGPRPDQLASAGFDGVIHTWNAADAAQISTGNTLSAISQRQPGAFSIEYSPDGSELAGGYADGSVRIWRFSAGDQIDHSAAIGNIGSDRDHRLIATTGADGSLHLLRAEPSLHQAPAFLSSVDIDRRVNDRPSVAVAADGEQVATANNNGGRIQVWDTVDPKAPRLATELGVDTRYTAELAYSPTGHLLASGLSDTTVALWDLKITARPRRARSVLVGSTDLITGVAFDRTGRLLAVSDDDRAVRIYDLTRANPEPVATLQTGATTPSVFSQTRDVLITGTPSGVALWDVGRPDKPHSLARVGDAAATSLAISPDGNRLAVGTADARLEIYHTASSTGPRQLVNSVADRADGRSASEDARWQAVFAADSGELIAAYTNSPTLHERTLDVNTAIDRICRRIGAAPTRAEWEQAIRGVGYQTPCTSR